MKKQLYFILIALSFVLVLNRCTSDFRLTAPYKEVVLVYGLLSQNETVHYIRIHKAFLDENTSALVLAANPDSIYYPDILDVSITESGSNQVYQLQRVDGDTLNPPIVKDSGTFAQHPNILYRFYASLQDDKTYTLKIRNTVTGKEVSASTNLVQDFNILRPFHDLALNWVGPTSFQAIWNLPVNGRVHDLSVRLKYHIANKSAPLINIKDTFVDIPIFQGKNFDQSKPKVEIPGDLFYQGIRFRMAPNQQIYRYADSLEFTFTVGSMEFSNFIEFNKGQTGITANQIGGNYTNINGGYGIFAARYSKTVRNIPLSIQSEDTLGCGHITGDLNFAPYKDFTKHPNYPLCD